MRNARSCSSSLRSAPINVQNQDNRRVLAESEAVPFRGELMSARTSARWFSVSIRLPLAFFASGAAALLFEILWFRALGRLLGNTVWAGALVLTAFMLGIALGGTLAARWTERVRRPARVFAMAEMVVAVSGLVLVWALPGAEAFVGRWLAPIAEHAAFLMALRLLAALAAMLVPTTAMGVTLALGVRALGAMRTARALGMLYAANTFGACIAPLAAELALIGVVGLRGTALIAAGLNILAAGIAWTTAPTPGANARSAASLAYKAPARLLAAAAIAGALALALEVVWFRLLLLHAPGSDENFAFMLAVVLLGIALGGALAPLLTRFSIAWIGAMSSVAVVLGYLVAGWPHYGSELVDYVLPLILPAAVSSGALFTLLGTKLSRSTQNPQAAIGRLTTANTLGAAAGAALAGLWLLPQLGIERSLFILAAGYALLPFLLAEAIVWPLLAGVVALAFFPFGRLQSHLLEAALPHQISDGSSVVRTVQGPTTTLQVLRRDRYGEPASWRLLTDSYSMTATGRYALRYMQLFAWLPLSLHPEPRRALLISYGAGNTASALLSDSELRHLTIVDLSPEILGTSALIHGEHDPLKDPRVQVVMEDGRQFLRTRRSQFDIITAEPPPPLIAGVVNLYTAEYFRALRERLAPGGLVTYWLPVVQFKPAGARAVIAAFCDAFADCTLWAGDRFDWVLMGGRDMRAPADIARLWRVPGAARLLIANGFEHPAQLGATFLADHAQLREWLSAVAPLTDDFPKRMAPEPRVEGPREEYERWLEPSRARRNFESSAWMEAHWPAQARRASLPYFDVQPALNAQIPRDITQALPHIDRVLRETDLRVPVLWMLNTDMVEAAIVARAVQAGGERPQYAYVLGAEALAERDYAKAAKYFANVPQAHVISQYAGCRARGRSACL